MQRPYFSSSIVALEAEFEKRRHDSAFLAILRDELSHRKTYRAKQLQSRVVEALQEPGPTISDSPRQNEAKPHLDRPAVPVREPINQPQPIISRSDKQASSSIPSELKNTPEGILDAWIGLEVLSPATFRRPEDLASNRDRRCVASLDREQLPWEGHGEKSRPNFQLFYHVMLGSVDLDGATALLLQKYSDSRVERPTARGDAVIAVLTLDRKGEPVGPPSASVSSFAWGVPVAFHEDLSSLARWPEMELRRKRQGKHTVA